MNSRVGDSDRCPLNSSIQECSANFLTHPWSMTKQKSPRPHQSFVIGMTLSHTFSLYTSSLMLHPSLETEVRIWLSHWTDGDTEVHQLMTIPQPPSHPMLMRKLAVRFLESSGCVFPLLHHAGLLICVYSCVFLEIDFLWQKYIWGHL